MGGHSWWGNFLLRDEYQRLYLISHQRDLTIQQIRWTQGGEMFWDLRFRRNFQDREVSEFQRLLALLYTQVNPVYSPNAWWWGVANDGVFSVNSLYKKLLIRMGSDFPCNAIWVPIVLKKVFFVVASY